MKIYPSKHSIIQTETVDLIRDIPLAYVDTNSKDYRCIIKSKLDHDVTKPILPYQEFNSYEVALFKPTKKGKIDENTEFVKIDHTDILQRVGDIYQYIPTSATTFIPQEFNYSVIVKKHLTYKTQENYDLKIGCIDDTTLKSEEMLSKKLLKVFGDAPSRGVCPLNISVNNKDISANSLTNSTAAENDFIFIQSQDGFTYKGFDYETYTVADLPIQFEKDLLSHHVNAWVSVKNFPISLSKKEVKFNASKLYKDVIATSDAFISTTAGEKTFFIETEAKEDVTMHHVFSGTYSIAIIKEYKNKGFVIYTPESFFDNIEGNVKVFYELLMYVYSNTYLESETVTQWITDTPPDYIIVNNHLQTIEKFMSFKQIHKFFDFPQEEMEFTKINISAENVKMQGIVNDYITFDKLHTGATYAKYADPPKPYAEMLSVYTPQRQIMFFDDFIYEIQDNVDKFVTWTREDNSLVFNLRSFKHTYGNINISSEPYNDIYIPLTLTINYQQVPIENTSFYIYSKEDILNYCSIDKYESYLGTIIAQIDIIKSDGETVIYDMRKRGGGLPEKLKGDQELLDIGYIKGLAYRKAGAVVITLPKRLEPHKELIENVVKKHIVAEKFPVILFEGED